MNPVNKLGKEKIMTSSKTSRTTASNFMPLANLPKLKLSIQDSPLGGCTTDPPPKGSKEVDNVVEVEVLVVLARLDLVDGVDEDAVPFLCLMPSS